MARIDFWSYFVDKNGRPLKNADIRVYLARTLTEANIYLDKNSSAFSTSSVEKLKTNNFGFVQFWVGDKWEITGGYDVDQQFKVICTNYVDNVDEIIDDLYLFAPVRPIDISDSIIGNPENKVYNRVISNLIGYKWDNHVDSIVPSASPHDLNPVVMFDLDDKTNKVISNKLGYQLYQMAKTASTKSLDISASRFYIETVNSWSTSGGVYYKDIIHNFNNSYTLVKINKVSDDNYIEPKRIEVNTSNSIRVWLSDNISVNIIVFG